MQTQCVPTVLKLPYVQLSQEISASKAPPLTGADQLGFRDQVRYIFLISKSTLLMLWEDTQNMLV